MTQENGTISAISAGIKNEKVALITGANRGIGLQVAKELAGHGFAVLVGSRVLKNTKEAVKEIGENAYPVAIDLTDQEATVKAAQQVRAEFGRLDLVVNNAGIVHAGAPNSVQEKSGTERHVMTGKVVPCIF